MFDARGSIWRKWDLHVHTPASLVQNYGGDDGWDRWLDEVERLPAEVSVLGINDYIFLDGYRRVVQERENGRLQNIDLVLPVVELRLDRFGGSKNSLSRVNYHIIFSDDISADVIEAQFLTALCRHYVLTPAFKETAAHWQAVPTRDSLAELGQMIIDSVPPEKRNEYGAPLIEGFNNLSVSLDAIHQNLGSHYFKGKVITAVGKTEWADIKWNDASIADKKTIINNADLVFISVDSVDAYQKARESLSHASVNDRLLDCSDAHEFKDGKTKDRLGNSRTWIKSDPTFEGLRQAVIEFEGRTKVSDENPLVPPYRLKHATFSFPEDSALKGNDHQDPFCFRGQHKINFSPYFTCLIGGRGTGKSTVLNLLHERSKPGENGFFSQNRLISEEGSAAISDSVTIDSTMPIEAIEFLPQNEIEEFATDPTRFTPAIFSRIEKLDSDELLEAKHEAIATAISEVDLQIERLKERERLSAEIASFEKSLKANQALVSSFKNDEYLKLNAQQADLNKELKGLTLWEDRLAKLQGDLAGFITSHDQMVTDSPNAFEQQFFAVLTQIKAASLIKKPDTKPAEERKKKLQELIEEAKAKARLFLEGRGLSPENLADVGKANEKIAEINASLPAMREQLSALTEAISEYRSHLKLIDEYQEEVLKLLRPINEQLEDISTEVKPIDLKYSFDVNSLRHDLVATIGDRLDSRARVDHLHQALEGVELIDLTTRKDLTDEIQDGTKIGNSLLSYFSTDLAFDLLRLEVERQSLEIGKHRRINVFYDGKPLENTSFGQRCTAAVVVLLLLGNTPIVIDEPESHLDSSLIAKYLVELIKTVKINRQIVFATHNANFVVNGDAELVHVLNCDDGNASEIVSTTIEDMSQRDRLLALEGGKEAFQRRERRYRHVGV